MPQTVDHFRGVILGTAVGDAIGLPREGLSRRRAGRLFGGSPLGHRLVFRRGMVSDDTEHTCMVAQALLDAGGDPTIFARLLARRLRWWFIALPAGVGMATAKSCIKLWLGFPPSRSGVWSAGNGPAMRAAILGVYANNDTQQLRELVTASTRLTHTDPAAEEGALAVALAAAFAVRQQQNDAGIDAAGYLNFIRPYLAGTPMLQLLEQVVAEVERQTPFEDYLKLAGLSRGISGYINHSVPACLYCWLTWPTDFRKAVEQIVLAGGDADSTGAIVGALAGITAGPGEIPKEWIDGLIEWPRTVEWMGRLADRLGAEVRLRNPVSRAPGLFWPMTAARNVFFLCIVLMHGIRRLLPPY